MLGSNGGPGYGGATSSGGGPCAFSMLSSKGTGRNICKKKKIEAGCSQAGG